MNDQVKGLVLVNLCLMQQLPKKLQHIQQWTHTAQVTAWPQLTLVLLELRPSEQCVLLM